MPLNVKAFNWSVTNLCVVSWDVQVNKQVRWTFLRGCPSSRPLFVFIGFFFIYLFSFISFFRLIVYCFCLFCMCSFVKQNRDVLSRSSSVSSVHSLWVLLSLIILQYCPHRTRHFTPLVSLFLSHIHSFPVTVPIISIINCLLHCVPHSHNSICN